MSIKQFFNVHLYLAIAEKTSTDENVTLNIDKKFLEMLKSSSKIFDISLNKEGTFSTEDATIFGTLENKICRILILITSNEIYTKFDDIITFAITLYNFGLVYIKITETNYNNRKEEEKRSLYITAERFFISCLDVLKDKKTERKAILIAVKAYDKLSYILIKLQRLEECYEILLVSINLYFNYTKDKYLKPIDVTIILGIDDKERKLLDTRFSLDHLHIENFIRLAILYNYNPENKHEYIGYMHILLNDILKTDQFLHEYCKDWAITAAELSQYFVRNNRFTEAKNFLAAAVYIMEKYNINKLTTMTRTTINVNQNIDSNLSLNMLHIEGNQYTYAKIANFCGQYGVWFLHASRKKLLQNKENQSCEVDKLESECFTKSKEKSAKFLTFNSIEGELKDKIMINDKYPSNLSDIQIIFQNTLNWFNLATAHYTIENDIRTYGEIILHMSMAYKYVAGFEQSKDKKIKIYEYQIGLLNNAIIKLSQSTQSINVIKKLMWLKLGISYSAISDIISDNKNNLNINKTNNKNLFLVMCNSINCFMSYLEVS